MDFLNRIWSQIVDLFQSMTPGARITAGLLIVVVVVSLGFLFRWQTASADYYLFGSRPLTDSELDQLEAAFAQADLSAWERIDHRIKIPQSDRSAYLAAAAEHNALPPNSLSVIDESTAVNNPFIGRQQREQMAKNAKQKLLSIVITKMEGVDVATVSFDEQQEGGLSRKKTKSAMVAVWPESGAELDMEKVRAIRDTVAGAIAGLDGADVTVIDEKSGRSYRGSGEGLSGPMDDPYMARKVAYEKDWRERILRRLSMYPGVVVEVNVELDPQVDRHESSMQVDPKAVAVSVKEASKNSNTNAPAVGGRPGAVPNGVGGANSPQTLSRQVATESKIEESQTEQQSIASQTQTSSRTAAHLPKKVTASIGVPKSYFEKVWRAENPTPDGEEPKQPDAGALTALETRAKQDIENAVKQLLLIQAPGEDPYQQVIVTTFRDIAQSPPPEPTTVETATTWLTANWHAVGMMLLGAVSLLMLRGMLSGSPESPAPSDANVALDPAAKTPGEHAGDEETEYENSLKQRFKITGPSLRDELAEMVREDPDAAASVLRNWISDAA